MSDADDAFAGMEPPGGVNYGEFQFRAKRWVLAGLAEAASAALPCSAVMPAMGCFRVRAGEGFLEFAATDMERTVLATSGAVDAKDTAECLAHECFIPARKLTALLKEAPDGEVTISVKKNQATVTAGTGSWVLSMPDSSGYPDLLNPGQMEFQRYSREKLLAALKAVRHVVCKDAGRPPLTQVDIKADSAREDDGIAVGSVTASDGIRFARSVLEGFPFPMTIPSSALDDLMRLLNAGQVDEVGISITDDALAFMVGPAVLAVQRRSTPFPDMDRLLLKPANENESVLGVDKDELAAAVRRVRINADGETSAIVIEVSKEGVTVVSRDKGGNSASETIPAAWEDAKDRVLCVNHVFLSEMLAAHPGKSCQFKLGKDVGKRRSMILLPGEGLTQVIVQMAPALVGY